MTFHWFATENTESTEFFLCFLPGLLARTGRELSGLRGKKYASPSYCLLRVAGLFLSFGNLYSSEGSFEFRKKRLAHFFGRTFAFDPVTAPPGIQVFVRAR
jgi:hypothetical protein